MICDLLCPGVQLQIYAAPGLQSKRKSSACVSGFKMALPCFAVVVIPGTPTGGSFEQPGAGMCSPRQFGVLTGRSCCPAQEFRDPLMQCLHQGLLGWG